MKFDEVYKNSFFEQVMADSEEQRKMFGLKLFDDPDESVEHNELQFYIGRVAFTLAHAITWIEQLHQAVFYMTDFGYGKNAHELGIKRPEHLLYNIENYLIRLQSVYDRCLQLTNAVFHIGMAEEHVAHSVIVSNLHVSRTKVPQLLKAVRKTLDKHAQYRHELIHKHSHVDADLQKIRILYMPTKEVWSESSKIDYGNLVTHRAERVRKFTIKKKEEFESINATLMVAVEQLMNEFLVQYNRQKSRLEKLI